MSLSDLAGGGVRTDGSEEHETGDDHDQVVLGVNHEAAIELQGWFGVRDTAVFRLDHETPHQKAIG